MKPTIQEQISCVERELKMRDRVYSRRVAEGKMSPQNATKEIELMKAVLATLESLIPLQQKLDELFR